MKKFVVLFLLIIMIGGCQISQSQYLIPNKDGMIVYNGFAIKKANEIKIPLIELFSDKVNKIIDTYLESCENVYYSVIPNKEYFIREKLKNSFDYEGMENILKKSVNAQYISLFDALSLDDYYKYDHHWRQEKLQKAVNVLGKELDFQVDLSDFDVCTYSSAIGVYARKNKNLTEELNYLTNDSIEQCIVNNLENKEFKKVYDIDKLNSVTSYDVFLSGATPLITIQNRQSANNKRLVIFRDSFTSSLAPLLISEYKEIVLIDLRYMMIDKLDEFVDFKGSDILFLYSSEIINNSRILR